MNCELCGKEGPLQERILEGTRMMLCTPCGGFGKQVSRPKPSAPARPQPRPQATIPDRGTIVQDLVENYGLLVKRKRESMGLKQQELARQLNIKESLLHSIESGRFAPSLPLARKLEKQLRLRLVDQQELPDGNVF